MRVLPFMKCVARAVLGEGIEKLAKLAAEFVPFGGYALEFVGGVARRTVEEMRHEHVVPRVAIADPITVVPPPWSPNNSPVGLAIESASGTVGGRSLRRSSSRCPGSSTRSVPSSRCSASVA